MSARGPKIKPSILKLIGTDALLFRDKPREALAYELKEKIEKMGEISPDIETIKRKISQARNHQDPLDAEWTSGTLSEYPINPVAVRKIFEMKTRNLRRLTIRTALWISRFCELPISTMQLLMQAELYSMSERVLGKYVEYADLDADMVKILKDPEKSMVGAGDTFDMEIGKDTFDIMARAYIEGYTGDTNPPDDVVKMWSDAIEKKVKDGEK